MSNRDIALALSGGGCRAAFFHLGVLKQLHVLGLADRLAVISSVSGGSIVAAAYAHWLLHGDGDFATLEDRTRRFLARHLDRALLWDFVPGSSSSQRLEAAYNELCSTHASGATTMSELDHIDGLRFIFNATANHSGRGWRFVTGGVAEEWELGQTHGAAFSVSLDRYRCDVTLGKAVAASAAFPSFSAVKIARDQVTHIPESPGRTGRHFYQDLTDPICLSDGGVRDNSGLTSILAGHQPPGFEDSYYMIGSDAGFSLRCLTKASRGRLRKISYLQRTFDMSHHHNGKLATYLMLTLHRRANEGKGAAMLRMDEAVLEGGERTDVVAQLASFETRLRPPDHITAERLIYHGATLLHARLTEYTDLLDGGQRLSGVHKQQAKD